jgi:hypothetical protein
MTARNQQRRKSAPLALVRVSMEPIRTDPPQPGTLTVTRHHHAGVLAGNAPRRRLAALLVVAISAFLLLFQQGEITVSDGATMYQAARSMAHGSLAIPAQDGNGATGVGGDHYSKYGIGLSLLAVPPYVLAKAAAGVVGHTDTLEQAAVASLMPLIAALLAAAVFLLSRRLGASDRSSVLVGAGAVLGTYALPYGKDFFAEPLTALFVTFALERAIARRPMAAGAFLGAACLTRPQNFILVPLLVPVVVWKQGARAGLRSLTPVLAAGVVQALLNVARFGSPMDFGYGGETFSNNLFSGLSNLLLAPSKSVVLFAPIVLLLPPALLLLWRRQRDACILLAGNLLITVAMTATWDSWQGGWSWGPRLLLPGLLPALAAVAVWLDARRANTLVALVALAVGFAVSASTLIVPTQAQQLDRPAPRIGPGVVRQIELMGPTVSYTRDHALTSGNSDSTPGAHRRFVNTWQVGAAREVGRSGLVAALAMSLLLLVVLVVAVWRLLQACLPIRSPSTALTPMPSTSSLVGNGHLTSTRLQGRRWRRGSG